MTKLPFETAQKYREAQSAKFNEVYSLFYKHTTKNLQNTELRKIPNMLKSFLKDQKKAGLLGFLCGLFEDTKNWKTVNEIDFLDEIKTQAKIIVDEQQFKEILQELIGTYLQALGPEIQTLDFENILREIAALLAELNTIKGKLTPKTHAKVQELSKKVEDTRNRTIPYRLFLIKLRPIIDLLGEKQDVDYFDELISQVERERNNLFSEHKKILEKYTQLCRQ